MKNLTRAFLFIVTLITAINSYSDDLLIAEEDYQNGWYEDALPVFLSYGTPGLQSQLGDPIAQYYLGEMFYYGEGVEQNFVEAMRWYLLSAEQDDPDAAYSIGFMYENGEGVEKSLEVAIDWYKRAGELGSDAGTASLGLLYLYEEGPFGNFDEGLRILKTAADSGNLDAQFYLGSAYYDGDVLEKDFDLALNYLRKAEQQGDSEALEFITWILDEDRYKKTYDEYISDMHLSPDDERAFRCENFAWSAGYGLALTAHEEGDERLLSFSEDALNRINRFGQGLDNRLWDSGYDTRQRFREISAWLSGMYEESNIDIRSKNRVDLPFSDQLIFDREIGGVFEIVFHPAFFDQFESLDDEQFISTWNDCIEEYMPDGLFSTDIGKSELMRALGVEDEHSSLLGRIGKWSKSTLRRISEISACEGDYDFVGGAAVGTLATSVVAGDSVIVLISGSGLLVASAPAVATGIAATALVGSAVYLTAKGYCFVTR